MTTEQVIRRFLDGASGSNGRISTDGANLYSYSTLIAFKEGGKVYVTQERYSITSTRHVSALRRALGYYAPLTDETVQRPVSVYVERGAFPYAGQGSRRRKMDDLDGTTTLATFAASSHAV
jgi:hypothetical protein